MSYTWIDPTDEVSYTVTADSEWLLSGVGQPLARGILRLAERVRELEGVVRSTGEALAVAEEERLNGLDRIAALEAENAALREGLPEPDRWLPLGELLKLQKVATAAIRSIVEPPAALPEGFALVKRVFREEAERIYPPGGERTQAVREALRHAHPEALVAYFAESADPAVAALLFGVPVELRDHPCTHPCHLFQILDTCPRCGAHTGAPGCSSDTRDTDSSG